MIRDAADEIDTLAAAGPDATNKIMPDDDPAPPTPSAPSSESGSPAAPPEAAPIGGAPDGRPVLVTAAARRYFAAMKTRAAVAYQAGKPLVIEEVELEGRRRARCWSRSRRPASATPTSSRCSGADPEGLFPVDLRSRGRRRRGRRRPRRDQREEGRPRHPALHARVPRLQVVPQPQDQPLHRHSRHPGQGGHARRHQPLLASAASRSTTTWAARRSRSTRCCPRSRWRRSARTRRSTRSATSAAA